MYYFSHRSVLKIPQFTECTKISALGFSLGHDSTLFHMLHSPDRLVFPTILNLSPYYKEKHNAHFMFCPGL